jgi:hypothetical protein
LPFFSRLSANARFRKDGAVVITPNDARAMPPDLMKNLLFIACYPQKRQVLGLWSWEQRTKDQRPKSKDRLIAL